MRYIKIEKANAIQAFIYTFNDCYPNLINRGINIDEFSKKLSEKGTVITYQDSDAMKGIICYYANDIVHAVGYISILWIEKQNRHEGIGTKLLDFSLKDMRTQGMKTVLLEVKTENKKAISFYMKNGFKIRDKAQEDSYYMSREI